MQHTTLDLPRLDVRSDRPDLINGFFEKEMKSQSDSGNKTVEFPRFIVLEKTCRATFLIEKVVSCGTISRIVKKDKKQKFAPSGGKSETR